MPVVLMRLPLVSLFDYLVGAGKQGVRHFKAECRGCLEIERQLVLRRRLHREVGGLGTLQDAIDVAGRSPVVVDHTGAVRYQPAGFDEGAIEIDRGHPMLRSQLDGAHPDQPAAPPSSVMKSRRALV